MCLNFLLSLLLWIILGADDKIIALRRVNLFTKSWIFKSSLNLVWNKIEIVRKHFLLTFQYFPIYIQPSLHPIEDPTTLHQRNIFYNLKCEFLFHHFSQEICWSVASIIFISILLHSKGTFITHCNIFLHSLSVYFAWGNIFCSSLLSCIPLG